MDRFKFRVWNNRDWDNDFGKVYYDAEKTYDYLGGNPNIPASSFGNLVESDEWILEQCTGLKDKNEKLIYEGDILKSIFSDEMLYEVVWCADCYKLRVFTKSSRKTLEYLGLKNTKTSYEVIGNIHENKDLLEANND